MTADRLTRAVRHQLGLGRLLPLGGVADGAWIAERAAVAVLRAAAVTVPGVRLERVRLDLADPDTAARPSVTPPPSGLPPGPLRLEADISARADEPLLASAERLRGTLARAAAERLGLWLVPDSVDLRVTELYNEPDATPEAATDAGRSPAGPEDRQASAPPSGPPHDPPHDPPQPLAARAAGAATAVPGVARLAPVLSAGGPGVRGVQVTDRAGENGGPAAGRHLQVQIAVDGGHRALDVALSVRAAVAATATADAPGPVTVAVLLTAIDQY